MNHPVAWTSPQPFWAERTADRHAPDGLLPQPQLLRFASDQFMDELLALLAREPAALAGYAATAETWRSAAPPPATDPARWQEPAPARLLGWQRRSRALQRRAQPLSWRVATAAETQPLKLYQPAHQRHYLVAGSLVCRAAGLPDRAIDPARHRLSFVVRRLLPRAADTDVLAQTPLSHPAAYEEHGFVPAGSGGGGRWCPLPAGADDGRALLFGEERLPLFALTTRADDGTKRRLFAGSVPVGRRETYQAAPREATAPAPRVDPQRPADDAATAAAAAKARAREAQLMLLRTQVLGPWQALVNSAMGVGAPGGSPDDLAALQAARPDWVFPKNSDGTGIVRGDRPDAGALRAARARLQTASWYLLADLLDFLQTQLPQFCRLHLAAVAPTGEAALPGRQQLLAALQACAMPAGLVQFGGQALDLASLSGSPVALSLADMAPAAFAGRVRVGLLAALRAVVADGAAAYAAQLEAATHEFSLADDDAAAAGRADWPDFLFLFADPWFGVLQPPTATAAPADDYLAEQIQARIAGLLGAVEAALAEEPALPARLPAPALAGQAPHDLREGWYQIRLVYERPDCAPFESGVISAATRPFQMAGFFDPDAPARPIRIGLPLDISPAGLRKFDKNTVFMLSDMLCGQIDRMKGIGLGDLVRSVLPWPLHKDLDVPAKGDCRQADGGSLGMMCTLSIPIITICALILLMIIVSLLDFVFRWLPYFVVCLPLPGFKGRPKGGP